MPINFSEQITSECTLHSHKSIGEGRETSPLSQPGWENVDQKTAAAVLERCQQQEPNVPETGLRIPGSPPLTTCLHYHAERVVSGKNSLSAHTLPQEGISIIVAGL